MRGMASTVANAALATDLPPTSWAKVKVLTLDATGTLLYHKEAVARTYLRCAAEVGAKPPPFDALKQSFREAFKSSLERWPCFGHAAGLSSREWWKKTVLATFSNAGASYNEAEFDRVFRRIYQHYGSRDGYVVFDDVEPFLRWASGRYCLGLVSNNIDRLADNQLPLLGLHQYFRFFALSQEVGYEKPSSDMFAHVRREASSVCGVDITPEEILHVGDNYAADYCGPRAAGMSAALLTREGVKQYQTWLDAPEYPGKATEPIQVLPTLEGVRWKLEAVAPA